MRWMFLALTVACFYAGAVAIIGWLDPTFLMLLALPVPFTRRRGLSGTLPATLFLYVGVICATLLGLRYGSGRDPRLSSEYLGFWILLGLPVAFVWSSIVAAIVEPYWRYSDEGE